MEGAIMHDGSCVAPFGLWVRTIAYEIKSSTDKKKKKKNRGRGALGFNQIKSSDVTREDWTRPCVSPMIGCDRCRRCHGDFPVWSAKDAFGSGSCWWSDGRSNIWTICWRWIGRGGYGCDVNARGVSAAATWTVSRVRLRRRHVARTSKYHPDHADHYTTSH
jgi:hypothetical protein